MAPLRTCIGCRKTRSTDGLVRLVRLDSGALAISRTLPGRGAWLCQASPECLEQAARRNAFSRALRADVGSARVDQLRFELGSRAVGLDGLASGGAGP